MPPMPPSMGGLAVRARARFLTHEELMALWNRAQAHGELFNVKLDKPFFARSAFPLEEIIVWTLDSAGQKVVQNKTVAAGQSSSWLGFWRFATHDHCWLMSQRESMRMRPATQGEMDGFEGTSLATPRPHAGFANSYGTLRSADALLSDFERDRSAIDAFEALGSGFRPAGAPAGAHGAKGRPFFTSSQAFVMPEIWRQATLLRESIYFNGARGSILHALPGAVLMATPGVDAANGLDWSFEIVNPFEFQAGWASDDARFAAAAVNEFTHSFPEPVILPPSKPATGSEPLAAPSMNLPSLSVARGEGMIFGNREDANAGAYEHAAIVDEALFDALPFDEAMALDASHPNQASPTAFLRQPPAIKAAAAFDSNPQPTAPTIPQAPTASPRPTPAQSMPRASAPAPRQASQPPIWKRQSTKPHGLMPASMRQGPSKSFAEAYGRKDSSAPTDVAHAKAEEPQGFFAKTMAAKASAQPVAVWQSSAANAPRDTEAKTKDGNDAVTDSLTDDKAAHEWRPIWSRPN